MATTDPRSAAPDRVVVLAPVGRDAAVVSQALGDGGGIACLTASDIDDLTALVREDAAGAALVAEEALTGGVAELIAALAGQPPWSDLPVLLLLAEGGRLVPDAARHVAALRAAGNVTVLVRPIPAVALVTAVQSALRARRRQYEVRELMAREHAARLQAEEANRTKDAFLDNVSHEMRTPLSAILLWAKMLRSGGTVDQHEAVEAIVRSAEAQKQLVDDLLDVSRITSAKLRLAMREVELGAIVRDAISAVRPLADARGVALDAPADRHPALVHGDPVRLQQVVWNLLTNAVKFTPQLGRVMVSMERDQRAARIIVRDTGKGIAPHFLPHLFERFRQDDVSMTRREGGLGLGLTIVRDLVEMHGGTVTANSEGPGRGATFTVTLPLLPTPRSKT